MHFTMITCYLVRSGDTALLPGNMMHVLTSQEVLAHRTGFYSCSSEGNEKATYCSYITCIHFFHIRNKIEMFFKDPI